MRYRSEVWMGLAVIAGIVLLYWGRTVLRTYGVGRAGYQISVYFWQVSPLLSDGSPIRMSGINVGKVLTRREVRPPAGMPPPEGAVPLELAVRIRCQISRRTRIRADYPITIREPSVVVGLGEAWVDIKPVQSKARYLRDGDTVFGGKPLIAADMADQLNTSVLHLNATLEQIKGVATDIRAIVGDPRTQQNFVQVAANIRQISENLAKTTRVVAEVSVARRHDLETAIANIAQLSGRLDRSAAAIEELVTDRSVHEDLRTTLAQIRESSENVLKATAHIEQVVSDPQNTENFQSTLRSVRSATDNLDRVSQNITQVLGTDEGRNRLEETFDAAQEAIENIRRISHDVQELTSSPANQENVETSLANIRTASEDIARVADHVDELLADGTVTTRVRNIVDTMDESSQALRDIAQKVHQVVVESDTTKNLQQAVDRINQVAADVQSITGDPRVRENVRESLENIRQTTERAQNLMGRADEATTLHVSLTEDLAYSPHIGRSVNIVDVDFDRGDQAGLLLGFYDVGFANSVKLQVTTRLSDRIRGHWGVYKGLPAIGVYYRSGKRTFGFDLYNPNSIRLDWNGYYMLTNDLRLSSRVEELFVGNRPLLGLGWVF